MSHLRPRTAKELAWMRSRIDRNKPKAPEANIAVVGSQTAFSRSNRGRFKHSRDQVRLQVVAMHREGMGQFEIAAKLGIPRTTIENWVGQTKLPVRPTSPYTLARMLAMVRIARNLWRQKFSTKPRACLIEAVRRSSPMKWNAVKVYLCLEAIPALPGFPLYADQSVQARCELLAQGKRERGCDLFDRMTLPEAPKLVALPQAPSVQGQSAPVAMPAVRIPVVDHERFRAARQRLQLPRLRL